MYPQSLVVLLIVSNVLFALAGAVAIMVGRAAIARGDRWQKMYYAKPVRIIAPQGGSGTAPPQGPTVRPGRKIGEWTAAGGLKVFE